MTHVQTPALRLLTFAVVLGFLYVFRAILWPLALAFVLATLNSALTRRVGKLLPAAGRRTVAVTTALLVGGLVLGAMATVVAGVSQILGQAPAVYNRIDQIFGALSIPTVGRLSLGELLRHVDAVSIAGAVAANLQSATGGLVLTALYLVFLTANARMIERRILIIVEARASNAIVQVLERVIRGIEAYTYIQTITGLMIAVVALIAMLAVGLENALFWALALFMLSYLPIVGVLVGSIGPTLFALLQFPTLTPAIIVFITIQAVSFVVGNLVLPKMQADSQNLDPTASLVAIGVWTTLWGIPGAFLAIPLTLALMYALAQYEEGDWVAVLMSNDGFPCPATTDVVRRNSRRSEHE